jgi:hypothetical protein
MKRMWIVKSLALAALAILAGCSNILAPQAEPLPSSGGPGNGTVRIDLEGPSSRTLLPAAAGGFARYDLLFEDQAEALPDVAVADYSSNDPVELSEGTWTVTASAYLDDGQGGERLAARGQAAVTVVYETEGESVPLVLRPVDDASSYTGNGFFAWDISFPSSSSSVTLEITGLDGSAERTLSLKGGPDTDGTLTTDGTENRSEGLISLLAGSYYVRTVLTQEAGKALRRDALFILEGMTTTADAAAGYAFTDASFGATLYVTSAADSGPGSLRQALADAEAGDTIRAALPPGSVIALESELISYTDALTIEGNGVTLTRGNGYNNNTALLFCYGNGVTLRRIHFRDGLSLSIFTPNGAAIVYNNYVGEFVLESCIFSGNQSNTGGTVYVSSIDLAVSGCTFYNNHTGRKGGAIYVVGGDARLTGNLFYGNTASSGNPVVYNASGTVTSGGYNVSDKPGGTGAADSGFGFVNTDSQLVPISFSRISFRPTSTGGALGKVDPSALGGYPRTDFYGDPLPASGAAAGAVQIPGADTDRILRIITSGSGTLLPSGAEPIGEGLYTVGAQVTLTANPAPGWHTAWWTVNGIAQEGNSAQITLNEDTEVAAAFGRIVEVADETGLRAALNNQMDYDRIDFNLSGDKTIVLNSFLPEITKTLTIEGNGATLARGFDGTLLRIATSAGLFNKPVVIRRLRFDGRSVSGGPLLSGSNSAITVESCIFSGFKSSNNGGGIYLSGGRDLECVLTALGCAFYGNETAGQGGAIYIGNYYTVKLAGNIFYGNSAAGYKAAVYKDQTSTVESWGYNVVDLPGGTGATDSGFVFAGTTDAQIASLPVSPVSFKPVKGSGALNKVDVASFNAAHPELAYPAQDFYGDPIPPSAAAGAVQGEGSGYPVNVVIRGPGEVTGRPALDADGFAVQGSGFTLIASPTGGGVFVSLTVNGQEQAGNTFTVAALDTSLEVAAVFLHSAATEAEFRAALTDSNAVGVSLSADITLDAGLNISKSFVIEGNGNVITQSGFTPGPGSQLLQLKGTNITVVIRRVHFKGGRATDYSAAIHHLSSGTLTLESCIFSDNQVSGGTSYGGAVYTTGVLDILGCTFYNNSASGSVIYSGGAVQLAGNLFYGNTAAKVAHTGPLSTVRSLGYNVSDKPGGTGTTDSGFAFATGDLYSTALPFIITGPLDFRILSTGPAYGRITARPALYPVTDFYGGPIPDSNAMAGAVQDAIITNGYSLDYGAAGPGTVGVKTGTPDSYGLYSGSVTLEATPGGGASFMYWTVNGEIQGIQPTPAELTLTMNGPKTVRGVFAQGTVLMVTSSADSGPGSLREALTNAAAGNYIVLQGQTITLNTPLPQITKSLTIMGNGATLTQSGFTPGNASQLLYINSTTATVRISRLHFKGGVATFGGAIYNTGGKLTLESCIFNGNQATADSGGAIFSTGNTASLTISGCTFVGNATINAINVRGGAIYNGSGTLTLAGNIFWGNTAADYSVVCRWGGIATSKGYNVSDKAIGTGATESGWASATGDVYSSFTIHPATFKPLSREAAYQRIATLPEGYPAEDFYGNPIPAVNAMAGAVQDAIFSSGYVLDYKATGPGTVGVKTGAPDGDGLYSGSVTLEATPDGGATFMYWTVNGEAQEPQPTPAELTLNMDSHKIVRGVFITVWNVTSSADSGAGSLREALEKAASGDYITLSGQTITLATPLTLSTNKSLVIQGNGATLTPQNGWTRDDYSQLLYISNYNAKVSISRLHFKGGRARGFGAAIRSYAFLLTLESCIFSDNQTTTYGGAIYHGGGSVSVSGCTFTGNAVTGASGANAAAGAINITGASTLTLTGNIFWGNTAATYSVVRPQGRVVISGGYNVSDKAIGTEATESGWAPATGDIYSSGPIHPVTFKPLSSETAYQRIATPPAGYPAVDFYGDPIPLSNAMAGAVQEAIITSNYALDYGNIGPGTVGVKTGTPDSYGLYSGSVTLAATPDDGSAFMHWTVDGETQGPQPTPAELILTVNGGKIVRGVFATVRTVTSSADSGTGSLREVLTNAVSGDCIMLNGQTITLATPLPQITKDLFIEGNGAVITQSGFTQSVTSQLLYIASGSPKVVIRRVHFKDGQAQNYGSAIRQASGALTLESCIFSGNKTIGGLSGSHGGAVFASSLLNVLGCTFYNNSASSSGGTPVGGAICLESGGSAALAGNLFYKNTASSYPVVRAEGTGIITSLGYNVSDKPGGTGSAQSGWAFVTGDKQLANPAQDPVDPSDAAHPFKPSAASLSGITIVNVSAISNYPATDFYGTARSGTVPAGAVSN